MSEPTVMESPSCRYCGSIMDKFTQRGPRIFAHCRICGLSGDEGSLVRNIDEEIGALLAREAAR